MFTSVKYLRRFNLNDQMRRCLLLIVCGLFTHADDCRGSEVFIGVCLCICLSVILSVCPQHNSETNDPKVFKLGIENDLGISYKCYGFKVKSSKIKVTGSTAKHIECDRVAGVSLYLYRMPTG